MNGAITSTDDISSEIGMKSNVDVFDGSARISLDTSIVLGDVSQGVHFRRRSTVDRTAMVWW
jgi:hypothetical protein